MFRRPQGYGVVTDPDMDVPDSEHDTFTCGHCQHLVIVPARCSPEKLGGLCKRCDQLICPRCVDKGICDPWEEQMKRMEARATALRSYGL